MKKKRIKFLLMTITLLIFMVTLKSCEAFNMEDEFFETNDLSEEMWINGSFAAPIISTKIELSRFIPVSEDSTFYVKIDYDGLIHLKSDILDIMALTPNNAIGQNATTIQAGTQIPDYTHVHKTKDFEVKVYNKSFSGHLFFADPKITITAKNELPIDIDYKIDSVVFLQIGGEIVSSVNETGISGTIKKSVETSIPITKDNLSVLPEIFSPIPKLLHFNIELSTAGQTTTAQINATDSISFDAHIDLPLEARLVDLVIGDYIPFLYFANKQAEEEEINGTPGTNLIESMEVRIITDNGFPFSLNSEIVFCDSTNKQIDSVSFFNLKAPKINDDGTPNGSAKSTSSLVLDRETIDKLKAGKVTKIFYKITMNTPEAAGGKHIKIYEDYMLGLKIGFKVNYSGLLIDTISNKN